MSDEQKREFIRFYISVIVEFKPTKESTEYSWGIINNFSYSGFSFQSHVDFEPRKNFEIKLKFPNGKIFSVQSDVVWKKQDGNIHSAGIKFTEKDSKVQKEILEEISGYGNIPLDRILAPHN